MGDISDSYAGLGQLYMRNWEDVVDYIGFRLCIVILLKRKLRKA